MRESIHAFTVLVDDDVAGIVRVFSSKEYGADFTEIGYCLKKRYCGKGFMIEACRSVIEFVGGNFCATVHPDNIASLRVLEKLGFRKDVTKATTLKTWGAISAPRNYYVRLLASDLGI
jgi:RimJ/RimL family protein N-acetyltransferase